MKRRSASFKSVAVMMAAVLLVVSVPAGLARAGLVATEDLIGESRPDDRARVLEFLARDDVRAQMARLGVDPSEAAARVAALSDGEVARLAGVMDTVPAGQAHPAVIVIAVAAFVFLVLLVTDLLGLTDIFPFVKKTKR